MVSSKHAHCYIIQFLCEEGVKPAGIHFQMKHEYSNDCVRHTGVSDWCKMFKEGRSSTEDVTCPSRPSHVTDPDTRAKVNQMVQCECHVTLQYISEHLGFSVEHVNRIITQVLGCWKVSAVWVLKS
jgi:hypothetical protein